MSDEKWKPRDEWLANLDKVPRSAAFIIKDRDGRILAVRSNYKGYWSLPGGMAENGEYDYGVAAREVEEEIGLRLPNVQKALAMVACRGIKGTLLHYCVFSVSIPDATAEDLKLQQLEITEARFFTKEEILSGEYPMLWALREYAAGGRGYYETRVNSNGEEEIIGRIPPDEYFSY